jgi:short-subunit dehydrogenase
MLAQAAPGHIVNTASIGGLVAGTATPIYVVSKHAVVALSECLYNSLSRRNADLNISVLCPGWVRTDIVDSDRNRDGAPSLGPGELRSRDKFRAGVESGIEPQEVGAMVVAAIKEPRFYIHTHPHWHAAIEERFLAIRDGQKPAGTGLPKG